MSILEIDEHAYDVYPASNAPQPDQRHEEDVMFAGEALESLRRGRSSLRTEKGWAGPEHDQAWMAYCLPHVARFYGVHRDEARKEWAERYGVVLAGLARVAREHGDDIADTAQRLDDALRPSSEGRTLGDGRCDERGHSAVYVPGRTEWRCWICNHPFPEGQPADDQCAPGHRGDGWKGKQ